jgi:hypothetical protein
VRAIKNAVAQALGEARAIADTRGVTTVLDRAKLEAASCEWHAIIMRESERNGTV